MSEKQRNLFGSDEVLRSKNHPARPAWFKAGTATQRQAVARGLHPLGLPLLEGRPGATCGSCAKLYARRHYPGPKWFKCELRNSHGPATDVRRKWAACIEYERATQETNHEDPPADPLD